PHHHSSVREQRGGMQFARRDSDDIGESRRHCGLAENIIAPGHHSAIAAQCQAVQVTGAYRDHIVQCGRRDTLAVGGVALPDRSAKLWKFPPATRTRSANAGESVCPAELSPHAWTYPPRGSTDNVAMALALPKRFDTVTRYGPECATVRFESSSEGLVAPAR